MENQNFEYKKRSADRKKQKDPVPTGWKGSVLLLLHDICVLLATVVVVFVLLFRVIIVTGTSMNDTLMDGDYLLLLSNTLYNDPQRGDIIVASKNSYDNGAPIIKRVIATGGQWVNIDFEIGVVYVGDSADNMIAQHEPYIKDLTTRFEGVTFPRQVPDGCLFVLGDNRMNSKDSRDPQIGMIDERQVLGKVLLRILPGDNKGGIAFDFEKIGVVD